MSMASWRREFYPITATSAARKGDTAALDHSIQKWRGLQPDALTRHEVTPMDVERAIGIDAESCALCVRHISSESFGDCAGCPLYEARGRVRCDRERSVESVSPWHSWENNGDPAPMLAWLLLARDKATP